MELPKRKSTKTCQTCPSNICLNCANQSRTSVERLLKKIFLNLSEMMKSKKFDKPFTSSSSTCSDIILTRNNRKNGRIQKKARRVKLQASPKTSWRTNFWRGTKMQRMDSRTRVF
jgi:hypothetical protein